MMKTRVALAVLAVLGLTVGTAVRFTTGEEAKKAPGAPADPKEKPLLSTIDLPKPSAIPGFVHKALGWLVEAQHSGGGWGAGSHANQQLKDPHKVDVDPATTSFAALALMRAGNTTTTGSQHEALRKATEYLVTVVEKASESGPKITDLTGTQPQIKLGQIVDTSLTAQYLARILPTLKENDALRPRVDAALTKCLRKLQSAQAKDGSWNVAGGGWAPVLQSSLSCSALELAHAAGKDVDGVALESARRYQQGNVDRQSGRAASGAAAGVELYAFAGGQKANASDALAAREALDRAKKQGKLAPAAKPTEENLAKAGLKAPEARQLAQASQQAEVQLRRLDDESLLQGFGNNGGEEFLSYLLTSESLVITGGEAWTKWNGKMLERLEKVQNPDGSWSGHHCITSPVFCTAAVIQCLTTDRDAGMLLKVAQDARVKLTPEQQIALDARLKEARQAGPVQTGGIPVRALPASVVPARDVPVRKAPKPDEDLKYMVPPRVRPDVDVRPLESQIERQLDDRRTGGKQ